MWKYMLLVLINMGILWQLFPVTICDPEDYLNYSCIQKYGNYTKDSPYKANLKTLMSTISSDTRINYGFYNISVGQGPDKVNGMAVCRGDLTVQGCHQCLKDSTFALPFFCGAEKEAIIWYDNCTLWYSNRFIFGMKEEQPLFIQNDGYNVSDPYQFKEALSKLLSRLQIQAASGDSQLKFATGQAKVSDSGNVYGMSQCSPDLSRDTCLECLGDFSAKLLNCCAHTQAASVRGPSCLVRHDSSLFYNIPGASLPQPPASSNMPSSTKHGKGRHKRDTWIIVGTLFLLSMLLLTLVCWFSTRKRTQITRCIQIALLCAQGNPTYRPMMSTVVLMLNSDTVPLPEPSKPGFMIQDELDQSLHHQSSQINNSHRGSVNEASISDFEPR